MRVVQPIFFLLAAGCLTVASPAHAQTPPDAPPVVDRAGFQKLLQEQKGRPLAVTFWATWCEPCREEYPMVNRLARQYAPQGLVVIGISLDSDAEINLVRHFLARNKPVFKNYRKRPGREEKFVHSVDPKWSGAIPATFFYARDGRLLMSIVGEHHREEFERAIRAILVAVPPGAAN